MKPRKHSCIDCGAERTTARVVPRCNKCATILKYAEGRQKIKSSLEALGHTNIEFIPATDTSKVCLSFLHPVCGTQQTWQASNVTKQLASRPDIAPCRVCGGKERAAKALVGFMAINAVDYDIEKWNHYQRLTRQLSDRNYHKHKAIINPQNHPRGMRTFHLDHKLPIFEGFKQGLEPAFIARVENLQMLRAFENISKGHRLT